MCRIAGIIDNQETNLIDNVKIMCDVMAHGGPDDEGFYLNETLNFAFGHRRLALIDLSKNGHQPMFYDNENLIITFNGEIYNYLELKDELKQLGFTFKTETDTEVILAAYSAWGKNSFDKLNGMFAFALFSKTENITYLVRDKSGIKPLYFSHINRRLVFASEVRAFEALSYPYTENPDWKIYFLAFGHIPEPYTTFKDINMLPKGHYLEWNHNENTHQIKDYQSTGQIAKITDRVEAMTKLQDSMKKSVEKHLISDANIGVFLSGGVDSSIISLLANEIKQDQNKIAALNTLSINFNEGKFSEKKYQDIITKQIGGNHAEYQITNEIFDANFESALNAMDQPTTDGINVWFVNYFAKKQGLKAVLSGIGADELFGGYPSFNRMGMVNALSKLPKYILRKSNLFKHEFLKRTYYLSYKNTIGKYLFLRGIFNASDISALLNCSLAHVDDVLQRINVHAPLNLDAKETASWMETNMYMQNQLLKDTDIMSMQHGVEVRLPFLDQDLIQLVKRFDSKIKFDGARQKPLLIDAFKKLLPEAIWNRPKMGFTFPFESWLKPNNMNLNFEAKNHNATQILNDLKAGKLHWAKSLAIKLINQKKPIKYIPNTLEMIKD